MPASDNPLIFGFAVDQNGCVRKLSWEDIATNGIRTADERVWVHLNRRMPSAREWVSGPAGFDMTITDALTREETRPRAVAHEDGWLINLRGVNFNEGDQDDFMIALRIYADDQIVVTTRAYKIRAAEDLANMFEAGTPPETNGDIITFLAGRLIFRMEPVVEALADQVDDIEDRLIEGLQGPIKTELVTVRREANAIRRYMSPQREALSVLGYEETSLLSDQNRHALRESQNILLRINEELEAVRDRAQIVQEQIAEQRAEEMNKRLFALSIISAVFLPLGFITGLFGVNIGGMPGVDNSFAFAALCIAMLTMVGGLLWLFRKLGWLS